MKSKKYKLISKPLPHIILDGKTKLSEKEHRKIHDKLHHNLDLLVADYLNEKKSSYSLSSTSIMDLMAWSYQQTLTKEEKLKLIEDKI